jgi:hypothetical protein
MVFGSKKPNLGRLIDLFFPDSGKATFLTSAYETAAANVTLSAYGVSQDKTVSLLSDPKVEDILGSADRTITENHR